jgi:uncharacterized protein
VKATVDAYDGTVKLYAFDDSDPILKAWNKAFGGKLIQPRSAIPAELQQHFRYPEDQFKVQRDLLAKFHVTKPNEFFSGQDFWQVPDDPAQESRGLKQPPYYLVAKLPTQEQTTFQLTAAVTPKSRANLAALMSASYVDGKPRIQLLQLPDQTAIFGPNQVQQYMTNRPEVARELGLLQQQNRKPVFGNLLSLPLGGGMLYVEPIYVRGTADNSYPTMGKVLLSYGNYVAYSDTIQQGFEDLANQAGGQPPTTTGPPGDTTSPPPTSTSPPTSSAVAQAAARIQQAITDLRAAQQSGDFTKYGQALQALDDAVKAYQAAQQTAGGSAPSGTPSPPALPGASPSQNP